MPLIVLPSRSLVAPDPFANGSQPAFPYPNSPWTDTVPATPIVKAKSGTVVRNLLTQGFGANGNPNGFFVGVSAGTPRYIVHGQQIAKTYGWTTLNVDPGGYWNYPNSPEGTTVWPVPEGWQSSTGTDHEIMIWDVDNHTIGSYTGGITYNGWSFGENGNPDAGYNAYFPGGLLVEGTQPTDGSYSGFGRGGLADPMDSGVATASGAPYFATNISYAEWLYGTINRALALTIATPTQEFYPPTFQSDGADSLGHVGVPYGSLFYLPPGTPEPNWATTGATAPALAHMVFVALKNYGMYAVDQTLGYGCDLGVEAFGPWARYNPGLQFDGVHWPVNISTAYASFTGMPWSSLVNIVPHSQLGSGGGGTSTIGGNTVGLATINPGTITLPNTVSVGDTLVLFVVFSKQGWNSPTPTGWTLLTSPTADAAGSNLALYTKTAAAGDTGGATITLGFSGDALVWNVVDVKNSPGATLLQTYLKFGFFGTLPATLSASQNLTLLFAAVHSNTTPSYWPDNYSQVNWNPGSPWSSGAAVFTGAAYGNDAFMPNDASESCFGVQVAV